MFGSIAFFLFAEDDDLAMPEVPADETVTDLIVASEEKPRDSRVDPESSPYMISLLFHLFVFLCRHLLTCFLFSCQ